jgi:hypothetical protein
MISKIFWFNLFLPRFAKQNIATPKKTRLIGSGKEVPVGCIPKAIDFGTSREKIREYGKTTMEKQAPKIRIFFFITNLWFQ